MRVIVDVETDAIVVDSDESRPGVIPDVDPNGKVIGFEILDASRHLPVPLTVALEIVMRVGR